MLAETLDEHWQVHVAHSNDFPFIRRQFQRKIQYHKVYGLSGKKFNDALHLGYLPYNYAELKSYVEADKNLIEQVNPDIIVSDFRLSVTTAAHKSPIPVLNLINAHWDPHAEAVFPVPNVPASRILGPKIAQFVMSRWGPAIFRQQLKGINRLRQELSLPTFSSLHEWYSDGTHVIFPDLPELFPIKNLAENKHFLGLLSWDPDLPLPPLDPHKTTIYFGMGSSGNDKVIKPLIEILSEVKAQVIFSTAGKTDQQHGLPPNFLTKDYVSGLKACAAADLVICNGGSGTVSQCIEAGTPLVGFANNFDQFLSMYFSKKTGLSHLMRTERVDKAKWRDTIVTLLESTSSDISSKKWRERAQNLRYENEFPLLVNSLVDSRPAVALPLA